MTLDAVLSKEASAFVQLAFAEIGQRSTPIAIRASTSNVTLGLRRPVSRHGKNLRPLLYQTALSVVREFLKLSVFADSGATHND